MFPPQPDIDRASSTQSPHSAPIEEPSDQEERNSKNRAETHACRRGRTDPHLWPVSVGPHLFEALRDSGVIAGTRGVDARSLAKVACRH